MSHGELCRAEVVTTEWPPGDAIRLHVRKDIPSPPLVTLGMDVLYHGTSAAGFQMPRGPASFSADRKTAELFVWEGGWSGDGDLPRILVYRVKARPRLVWYPGQRDIEQVRNAQFWLNAIFGRTDVGLIGSARTPIFLSKLCKRYDGIVIDGIDSGGQEVVLCRPERWLRFEQEQLLGP